MFSSFPYFAPKMFCFLVTRLLVCLRAFIPYLLVNFFPYFGNVLFFLYCLILSRYFFSLPSFASTFGLISSNCIVYFNRSVVFIFSYQHFPVFFYLITFACCRRLLWLIFSVSALTVLKTWFFKDGYVAFFSEMILFVISIFIFLLVLVFVECGLSITIILRLNSVIRTLFLYLESWLTF